MILAAYCITASVRGVRCFPAMIAMFACISGSATTRIRARRIRLREHRHLQQPHGGNQPKIVLMDFMRKA